MVPEDANAHSTVAQVKKMFPYKSIFLRPHISASLPKGTRNTAADSKKAMAIQLNSTAFICRSLPILGRAMLTADPIKGLKNEDIIITASRMPRFTLFSEPVVIKIN
jgi:hypothetical protein